MKAKNQTNPTLVSAFGDILTFYDPITGKTLGHVKNNNQSQMTFLCPLQEPELFASGGTKKFVLPFVPLSFILTLVA